MGRFYDEAVRKLGLDKPEIIPPVISPPLSAEDEKTDFKPFFKDCSKIFQILIRFSFFKPSLLTVKTKCTLIGKNF